jgi:hypothetical protein
MSALQPSDQASRAGKRKRTLVMAGIGLVAALCLLFLLMSAVERVRDASDRTH